MLFKPLFFEDKLLCFAWCFVHSSDVGGLVPGSIAPTAYDRYQEGLTVPPTKLVKAGKLNEEFLNIILANCRIPEQNWGDMKALLAALQLASAVSGKSYAIRCRVGRDGDPEPARLWGATGERDPFGDPGR